MELKGKKTEVRSSRDTLLQSSRLERYMQVVERRNCSDPRAASKIMRLVRGGICPMAD